MSNKARKERKRERTPVIYTPKVGTPIMERALPANKRVGKFAGGASSKALKKREGILAIINAPRVVTEEEANA